MKTYSFDSMVCNLTWFDDQCLDLSILLAWEMPHWHRQGSANENNIIGQYEYEMFDEMQTNSKELRNGWRQWAWAIPSSIVVSLRSQAAMKDKLFDSEDSQEESSVSSIQRSSTSYTCAREWQRITLAIDLKLVFFTLWVHAAEVHVGGRGQQQSMECAIWLQLEF